MKFLLKSCRHAFDHGFEFARGGWVKPKVFIEFKGSRRMGGWWDG
jgi:hypothetical protein